MFPRECNDQYRIISNRLFAGSHEKILSSLTDTCNIVFTPSLSVENFIVNTYKSIEGGVIAEKWSACISGAYYVAGVVI